MLHFFGCSRITPRRVPQSLTRINIRYTAYIVSSRYSERAGRSRRAGNTAVASQDAGDFSKKYANAKSISSSQVFGDDKSDVSV